MNNRAGIEWAQKWYARGATQTVDWLKSVIDMLEIGLVVFIDKSHYFPLRITRGLFPAACCAKMIV